jgi:integrase
MRAKKDGTLRVSEAPQYEPGRIHHLADGRRLLATRDRLFYLGKSDEIIVEEPNGTAVSLSMPITPETKREVVEHKRANLKPDADTVILRTWIEHRRIGSRVEADAWRTFQIFKRLTSGKQFSNATRGDGRTLAIHLFEKGNKSATVDKLVGHLRAAANLAIKERNLDFNPFADVVPRVKDGTKIRFLNDEEMKLVHENMDKLRPEDRLLVIWLATTGMRLSEPFQVQSDDVEEGIRFVTVGTKTESSLRELPIPEVVLSHLPSRISGPLFRETSPQAIAGASKRLNRFLDACGIVGRDKVVHSLRHRAVRKLRTVGCPEDIREAICGHDEITMNDHYGRGFPMTVLKPWVDRIGW